MKPAPKKLNAKDTQRINSWLLTPKNYPNLSKNKDFITKLALNLTNPPKTKIYFTDKPKKILLK